MNTFIHQRLRLYLYLSGILVTVATSLSFILVSSAVAQNPSLALSVNPPVNYIWVKPGEKKVIPISIQNQGNTKLKITTKLARFEPNPSTGQPVLVLDEAANFPYITPEASTQEFTLDPQGKYSLTLPLNVSGTAPEREYHLSLLVSATPDSQFQIGQNTGAEVSGIVASNLIVTVSSTDTNRGQLELSQFNGPRFIDSLQPLSFQLLAKNSGPHAVAASGSAVIKNWSGQSVAEFAIYPDIILSQSRRPLRTTGSQVLPPEQALESISEIFKYDPLMLIGPYTIELKLWGLGEQTNSPTEFSTQVIALPFSGLAVLLIMGICAGIYIGLIKKRDHRSLNETQKS